MPFLKGTHHRGGGLDLAFTITQATVRQHWNSTQRPSYRGTSSEMKSLLPPRLHTYYSRRSHTRTERGMPVNLAFTEDFAIMRGAPLRGQHPRSLIGYSLILRQTTYIIDKDIQFSAEMRLIRLTRFCFDCLWMWARSPAGGHRSPSSIFSSMFGSP